MANRLYWSEGKKEYGCTYHKTSRFKDEHGNVQIDVFVMPKIVSNRPIAITVGRYFTDETSVKEQLELKEVDEASTAGEKLHSALRTVSCQEHEAALYSKSTVEFLIAESAILASVLREARNEQLK